MPTGNGFADIVFMPLPHYLELSPIVVELKWDKDVQAAIDQIKERKYVDALKDYKGNLLLVGINYDKKTRKHECKIEKFKK